jgi:DNA-binding Xre family transcriptional regulator
MVVSYDKLWHLLIDRKLNKTDLKQISGASSASIAKLGRCENIQTDVLIKICRALQVNITDIMETVPEESVIKRDLNDNIL